MPEATASASGLAYLHRPITSSSSSSSYHYYYISLLGRRYEFRYFFGFRASVVETMQNNKYNNHWHSVSEQQRQKHENYYSLNTRTS